MSNGVVTSACCCNQGCQTDCCGWWACSPDGEINVTLTGSKIVTRTITPGGQNWIEEEISWSITATMQRTGSTCTDTSPGYPNLYRYEAASCEFSWEKIRRLYSHGFRWTCNDYTCSFWPFDFEVCCYRGPWLCSPLTGPGLQAQEGDPCGTGDPCGFYDGTVFSEVWDVYTGQTPDVVGPTRISCRSWNCKPFDESDGCGSAGCEDVIEFRPIQVTTESWTGTLYGGSSLGASIGPSGCSGSVLSYGWWAKTGTTPNPVLVIVCTKECGGDCVQPMLIFNPDSSSVFVQTEVDRTMDPCCNANPCEPPENCLITSGSIQPWFIWPFLILGKGDCLDATTFDEPKTGRCLWPFPWHTNPGLIPSPPNGYAGNVDMTGIYDQPCSPLERIDSNKECRDEAYMFKNQLFCGWEIPRIDENGFCFTDFYFCYWNPWCEATVDSRTWNWGVTLGGA